MKAATKKGRERAGRVASRGELGHFVERLNCLISAPRDIQEREIHQSFDRVSRAAQEQGGANPEDVGMVWGFLCLTLDRMWRAIPLAESRLTSRAALENKKSRVSDEERMRVMALDAALAVEFPTATPRYREIAQQLDMKLDRVRYIVTGSRRSARRK